MRLRPTFGLPAVALAVAACVACSPNPEPVTPLALAARNGDLAAIDRLIDAGAQVNEASGTNAWTPLTHAVHKGQHAAVERLLARGATMRGSVARAALLQAATRGDAALLDLLLTHGARVEDDGADGEGLLEAVVAGSLMSPDTPWRGCGARQGALERLRAARPDLKFSGHIDSKVYTMYARLKGCPELGRAANRLPSGR